MSNQADRTFIVDEALEGGLKYTESFGTDDRGPHRICRRRRLTFSLASTASWILAQMFALVTTRIRRLQSLLERLRRWAAFS